MPKFCYVQQPPIPIGNHLPKQRWKTAWKFSTPVQTDAAGSASAFQVCIFAELLM